MNFKTIKKLPFLYFIIMTLAAHSQKLAMVKDDITKKIYVKLGAEPQFDETLKFAFDKYWAFGPKEFITKGYEEREFRTSNYGIMAGLYQTHMSFVFSKKGFSCNTHLQTSFDDLKKKKKEIGFDDLTDVKNKIILYVKLICRQIETQPGFDCAYNELPLTNVTTNNKLSSYNIIVAKNITDKLIGSEEIFKNHIKNLEIKSGDEINKQMREDKITENTAQLIITHIPEATICSVIDMKTGDLVSANVVQTLNSNKRCNLKRLEKLLSGLK